MNFEGLCFLAMMLFLWLVACDIQEIINLSDIKSEERREIFRQEAYARTREEAAIRRNREQLWEENL